MATAVNLQRDAGIMLSNLQILSQFVTSLHRMSSEMHGTSGVPCRRDRSLVYSSTGAAGCQVHVGDGSVAPTDGGPGDPGPVPASSCNACMNCRYCFPEGRLPPE